MDGNGLCFKTAVHLWENCPVTPLNTRVLSYMFFYSWFRRSLISCTGLQPFFFFHHWQFSCETVFSTVISSNQIIFSSVTRWLMALAAHDLWPNAFYIVLYLSLPHTNLMCNHWGFTNADEQTVVCLVVHHKLHEKKLLRGQSSQNFS